MSIYRKEALNPSERNSPFIFGKIQTAPAAINNREKLFLPNQISWNQPMIQFIAIYLLCLRDTYLKRMFTGRQVTNNSLLRHHIATRTPIGTGQIRRSQRFFNLFCRIPLITYICGNSWYQPYSRGRIKTAERSTDVYKRQMFGRTLQSIILPST